MEIRLDQIKGVGPKIYQHFKKAGIRSTYDLLLRRPRKYDHFIIKNLDDVKHKDVITVLATVITLPKEVKTKRLHILSCKILIDHQNIKLTIFNRPYLMHQLKENETVLIKGTYNLYDKNLIAQTIFSTKTDDFIKPIYNIEGIYDLKITDIIKETITSGKVNIYEVLPLELLIKYRLLDRQKAIELIHLPHTSEDIIKAVRRMKYEEAFFLQLKLQNEELSKPKRPPKAYDIDRVKKIIKTIPYELTKDQKNAVNDIFKDFKKDHTAYRLILGDVGSGKTIVAGLAIYAIATAHQQIALMAPTELLAQQHYQFFKTFLKDLNIELLTKNTKNKDQVKTALNAHQIDLLIGTHALLLDDVHFSDLGLIIIDEQHKFGVEARNLLIEKAKEQDVIYLSATPIPRTLAMLYFNQADISIIKEKPQKRKTITTTYLTTKDETKAFKMIEEKLDAQEHVYVVVPAISSDKVDDNILTTQQKLEKRFPDRQLFLLHGKLKEDQKNQTMLDFKASNSGILLSTTMIEVGIDIPTATLMVIFSAERFGLAQIHQLRGRVGRSHLKSHCLLISSKEDVERLKLLETIEDGFTLSEYDLNERGPGDFLGTEQSGYLDFKYLNILTDEAVLKAAYEDVKSLLSAPDFKDNPKYRYLRQYIQEMLKI